jgi:putative oxidoreductase
MICLGYHSSTFAIMAYRYPLPKESHMTLFEPRPSDGRGLAVLRFATLLLFFQHPLAKFLHVPAVPSLAHVELLSLLGVAGLIELVCGLLLLTGFHGRAAAFILSGEMAFAYFIGHAPRGFFPALNGGEPAALYCFVFLYLSWAGCGAWSIDGLNRNEAGEKRLSRRMFITTK